MIDEEMADFLCGLVEERVATADKAETPHIRTPSADYRVYDITEDVNNQLEYISVCIILDNGERFRIDVRKLRA